MKKSILILIFLCVLVFPGKVKSESITPAGLDTEFGGQNLYIQSEYLLSLKYTDYFDTYSNKINIHFNTPGIRGNYTLTFYYYSRYTDSLTMSYGGQACLVDSNVNPSGSDNHGYFFNVVCPNVNITSNQLSLQIRQYNNINYNSGFRYGFSTGTLLPNNIDISSQIASMRDIINSAGNSIDQSIKDQTDQQHKDSQATQDKIQSVDDTLNDGSTDDPSGSFNDYNDKLAKNGVITNLITLPIRLFTNVLNNINVTCTNFNLGELMGHNLTLPCINLQKFFGSFLWNVIDILFSGFAVIQIAKKMIKVFENFSSMKEGDVLGD